MKQPEKAREELVRSFQAMEAQKFEEQDLDRLCSKELIQYTIRRLLQTIRWGLSKLLGLIPKWK